MSFTCFLAFLKILRYFSFSRRITMYWEILGSAFYDILFFLLIVFTFTIAFSIVGYIMFGISDKQFSTFSSSLMTMVLISVGHINAFNINTTMMLSKTIFGITFMILTMMLIIMMVSIVSSHYFEYQAENQDDKPMGIIKLFVIGWLNGFQRIPGFEYQKLNGWEKLKYQIKLYLLHSVDHEARKVDFAVKDYR